MGKVGLRVYEQERPKSIFPEAAEESTTREANILHQAARRDAGFPGMKRSWGCPVRRRGRAMGRRALPIHQHPSGFPSWPWDKSNRKRGREAGGREVSDGEGLRGELREGGEEGPKRQREGEEKPDQRQKFIRDNGIIYFSCC